MLSKLHYKILIFTIFGAAILSAFLMFEPLTAIENADTNQTKTNDFGKLPLSFEPNVGQTSEQVRFLSRGKGYTLFLAAGEAVLRMRKAERGVRNDEASGQTTTAILRMRLEGANPTAEVVGRNELAGKSNYFVGDNPND